MKKIFLFLFVLFSCSLAYAEDSMVYLSDWKIFSSFADINSAVTDSKGKIWCATYGGVLIFNPDTKSIKYLSYADGLISTDITAIGAYGDLVIIGTGDGIVSIIDQDYKCVNFSDISRASFTNLKINDIEIRDNKAFIGGGFGLAVFDLDELIFTETVTKMGNFTRNTEINDVFFNDNKIYSATKEGLAYAELDLLIQDPGSWTSIPRTEAIKRYSINLDNMINYEGTIYLTADSLMLAFEADTFRIVKQLPVWSPITSIFTYNNALCYTTYYYVKKISDDETINIKHPLYDANSSRLNFAYSVNTESIILFIAYKEKSFGIFDGTNLELYDANSPLTKQFTEMQIDSKSRLWAATGLGSSAKGVTMYDGTNWHNFYTNTVSKMASNSYFKVYIDNQDRVYASNWGKGFAILNYDNELSIDTFNNNNSPLSINIDMTIATGFKQDRTGAIWFLNAFANASAPLLIKRNSDNTFEGYPMPNAFNINRPYFLEIDNNDTKWIGSSDVHGLFYQNIDRNVSGNFKSSNSNLQSNTITALAYDKLGTLWIGTSEGLAAMINPGSVITNSTTYIRKVAFLSTNYINAIHVDAINNKWIATNEGIWVLSPDGTEVLAIVSTKNSALTTNKVISITSDPKSGRVYFSTEKGLFSASTLSAQPKSEYQITCYPQPFNPEKDNNAVIEGLVKDTYISITTTDGKYIRSIQVLGNRAVWDGRDDKGNYVGNGVYLLISSSTNEGQFSVGKIAVKRN